MNFPIIIDKWLNSINISKDEISFLRTFQDFNINENKGFTDDFNLLLDGKIAPNQHISFDSCATNIIDRLFSQFVDDNTLVITTSGEHQSVVKNLEKCKHVIQIFDTSKINQKIDIKAKLNKVDRVFIYILGLSAGNNFYCSNNMFEYLHNFLDEQHKPYITVLDAVQEMFLMPRDYSIFDYVIGTAHAIIPNYNSGIVISKEKPYTANIQNALLYALLNIVKKYKYQMQMFNFIMQQEFQYELFTDKNIAFTCNSPFIFNVLDAQMRLFGINDDMFIPSNAVMNEVPATFRAFPMLIEREKHIQRIIQTHFLLR